MPPLKNCLSSAARFKNNYLQTQYNVNARAYIHAHCTHKCIYCPSTYCIRTRHIPLHYIYLQFIFLSCVPFLSNKPYPIRKVCIDIQFKLGTQLQQRNQKSYQMNLKEILSKVRRYFIPKHLLQLCKTQVRQCIEDAATLNGSAKYQLAALDSVEKRAKTVIGSRRSCKASITGERQPNCRYFIGFISGSARRNCMT